ncbi:type II toxin-antitoxin system RelE/ParE family toxin [Testudinibacter aquarius]|uniref:Killer protein n=1 Tax=Testudinibacter aquarius TaxID=1524974 RepID=A0A4R3XZ67_9PAST|nr:type II toxin-antitoxin system RelE/ParE family toxin [Testudinibacter aquarius]KAE9528450.1 Killer protein [Testudinibacter aquarius]TCV84211.1 proteic killer suppression protein [Testudinibacter aquarius]TNG92564.1 Killer protein [Testudinibacter aquarius]
MIIYFKHKGLKLFFESGNKSGIQASQAKKIARILARLDSAKTINDMNLPDWGLHPLLGKMPDYWSVKINGNWRITFKLSNGHAEIVDYQDYQ